MKITVEYIPSEAEFVDGSIWFDDGKKHLIYKPF